MRPDALERLFRSLGPFEVRSAHTGVIRAQKESTRSAETAGRDSIYDSIGFTGGTK